MTDIVDPPRAVGVAARGTGWALASALVTRGLSWLVTLAVARSFPPSQFGLVALCWVIYTAAVVIRDLAVMSTVIVAKEDKTLQSTVFFLNIAISVVVAAGVIAMGWPVSSLVGLDAVSLLTLFAVAYVGSAIGSVAAALLQRSLRFKMLAVAELVATLVYVASTIGLIAVGVGTVAVGWGQAAGATIGSLTVSVAARYWPSGRFEIASFRRMARYSLGTSAFAVLSFVFTNIDTVWVAARAGADNLGQYALAFNVAFVFAMTLTQVVQKVTFSTQASLRGDDKSGRTLLLDSERLVLATALVATWVLLIAGPDLVTLVFGSNYSEAGGPLRVLAIYGLLAAVASPAVSFLRAQGRLRVVIVALLVQIGLAAVGLAAVMQESRITAAAVSVCAALAVGTAMVLGAAFRLTGVGREAWGILPRPMALIALAVPLALSVAGVTHVAVYTAAGVSLVAYLADVLEREKLILSGRRAGPGRYRSGLETRTLLACVVGALVVGVAAALAPLVVVGGALVIALAWIASANLRASTLIVVGLVPVLPIGLYFDIGPQFPLMTASRGLVGVLVLAATFAVARGLLRWRRWSAWWALGIWLLAVAASIPGSIDPAVSRFRLLSEVLEVAAFAGIVYCVFDRSTYRQVLRVLVAGAAVGGLLGILQIIGFDIMAGLRDHAAAVTGRGNALVDSGDVRLGAARAQGTFQAPSFLGAGMSLALPIAYALYIVDARYRRWWALAMVSIIGGLAASITRAAWLAAAGAILWVLWMAHRRGYPTIRHLYAGALAVLTAAIALPSLVNEIIRLIAQLFDRGADLTTATTNYRIVLHEQVLATAGERPWSGFGAGTFDQLGITAIERGHVVELRSPDSHLLRLLAEVGLIGAVAFAGLITVVLWSLVKSRRSLPSSDVVLITAVIASAVGFSLVNLTISAFPIAQCSFFFWAMVAAGCAAGSSPGGTSHRDESPKASAEWADGTSDGPAPAPLGALPG